MKNKTVIITGAGSGIGRAIAQKFSNNGANVVVSDLNEEAGNQTVELIKQNSGKAIFIKADTSSAEDSERLVVRSVEQFGQLHYAVNNAGIGSVGKKTGEYPIDRWEKEIAVNLSGVFYGLRFQIPEILKSGGGAIVNISSVLGSVATPLSPAYIAAKHGVVGLTKAAALEYAQQHIRINAVGPGYTDTPLLSKYNDDKRQRTIDRHPIGRLGKPEEIANVVYWLCTDDASFVTGSYYTADGGYTAQ